jgi:hypothetical protein
MFAERRVAVRQLEHRKILKHLSVFHVGYRRHNLSAKAYCLTGYGR